MVKNYRDRTFELCRLDQPILKAYARSPEGTIFHPQWSSLGVVLYSAEVRRTDDGLLVKSHHHEAYEIPITQTQVTYGSRNWWQCPNGLCKARCAILYLHNSKFVCRKCARPAYASQNDYRTEYLNNKVREMRKRLWPDEYDELLGDNLLASCADWPKPKWMHWRTFEQRRAEILNLEAEAMELWPQ
jgi:hypothetical protein